MLLLAAADFHGDRKKFDRFRDGIQEYTPHLAILAGDIIKRSSQPLLDIMESVSIPLLVTRGNMDPPSLVNTLVTPPALDMNDKHRRVQGLSFVGIGDTVPHTIYSEVHHKTMPLHALDMDVVISHRPPYGYQDQTPQGGHIGDEEVYTFLVSHRPRLLLCGHVHENPGYQKMGNTLIVNCSVGHMGHFSLITLNDDITVEMVGY